MDENKNNPRSRKLSESQEASVNEFIRKVMLILPMLGVNILRSAAREDGAAVSVQRGVEDESPLFELVHTSRGVDARMRPVDGELFVLEGSRLIKQWDTSAARSEHTRRSYEALAQQHRKLIADGSLRVEDDVCVLLPATSCSTRRPRRRRYASAVVVTAGRPGKPVTE